MWTVYILESVKTGRHYIGCTHNLDRRLQEHNLGQNTATKWHKPWSVVYKEVFAEQSPAYAREKQIKLYKGGEAFKKLLSKSK